MLQTGPLKGSLSCSCQETHLPADAVKGTGPVSQQTPAYWSTPALAPVHAAPRECLDCAGATLTELTSCSILWQVPITALGCHRLKKQTYASC